MTVIQILPKKVVLAGDFNLFLDASLEALVGNPTLKKKIDLKGFSINRTT